MKKAGIALASIFAAAAGTGSYEAYKLNNLVWSAPEAGDVEFWKRGGIADVTLTLERRESFIHREDYVTKLNIMFADRSADLEQVCVTSEYELSGIFKVNPESDLLRRYIEQNPVFTDFIQENVDSYKGKVEINNTVSFSTYNDCSDSVRERYAEELAKAVTAQKSKLGL